MKKQMTQSELENICNDIYERCSTEQMAQIVSQVGTTLDDIFYETAPSLPQQVVIETLKKIAPLIKKEF